jgi:hypothetical protein
MDQIAELARIKGIAKGVDVFPSRENMVIPIGTGV